MDASLIALAFENQPEPMAIVVGGSIQHRNRAWSSELGESTALDACFHPGDRGELARVCEEARGGRAATTARLAPGDPKGGERRRLSLWSVGEDAVALRLDPLVQPFDVALPCDEILASPELTLQWAFRNMDAILWTTKKDGIITVSHGPGLARYNLKEGQVVGLNAFEVYPKDSDPYSVARRALDGEIVHEMATDGSVIWNRICVPMRDAAGEIVAMVGFSTAVNADAPKMKYAERLFEIVSQLPIVVWAMKADGTCTLSVGQKLDSFGFKSGDLVGKNLLELYRDNPVYAERFRRAIAGDTFVTEEQYGDAVFTVHYIPEKNFFGEVIGVYSVVQDITEVRRAEREMRAKEGLLASQERVLSEVVSPIIEVWHGVLVVPLIGGLGQERAALLTEKLLGEVVRRRAGFAILDLTGVDRVDEGTADHLFQIMRSVELLGCSCLVSGIQSRVAQTMVTLGVPMKARAFQSLADALRSCLQRGRAWGLR